MCRNADEEIDVETERLGIRKKVRVESDSKRDNRRRDRKNKKQDERFEKDEGRIGYGKELETFSANSSFKFFSLGIIFSSFPLKK